ncbi:MAG: hypothetical protein ACLUHK_04040 [Eubacteriales bacterium]
MEKIKIFLDTDIGDDIDDALAVALLMNSPEAELAGVTTVMRDTLSRAGRAAFAERDQRARLRGLHAAVRGRAGGENPARRRNGRFCRR